MPDTALLKVGVRNVTLSEDPEEVEEARKTLATSWFLRVPGLLDQSALDRARRELGEAELQTMIHPGIGVEACFRAELTLARLEMQLNDRRVLELATRLAGVRIGCFRGRIYRVLPGAGHHDSFHDDDSEGRKLALTLNLSDDVYRGSTLEIRAKGETDVALVPNATPGDAVLFRIDEKLEHRISALEGDVPKTAMAGWFCTYPEFDDWLLERVKRRPAAP